VSYNLERKPTLGKPCYAGHFYANVKPNGDVFRCGQLSNTDSVMGNIFDPDFKMYPGAAPCPVPQCVCSEYVYLAEEWDKSRESAPVSR
jgi:MoaA/NifB/PqqE/SkfB family radical SAM enzyme